MNKRRLAIAAAATAVVAAAAIPALTAFADDSAKDHWCKSSKAQPLYELVSADGTGRLYTLNKEEAKSAVDNNHMTLHKDPVAYLPCRETTDTIALERLKPTANADKWLLSRADGDEADRLEAKGWINEGVTGFAYRDPKGKILLERFTNGEEWRIAPDDKSDALEAAGYKLDGPLGYAYAAK